MDILEQLERDEGVVLHPYRDSRGFLTIGIGHNLDAKDISLRAARVLLEDDVSEAKSALLGCWPWMRDLSVPRLGAFINLAFNLGINGLRGFHKMLAAAEVGDYALASAELLSSKYAGQVGDRAVRLATQLHEDRWV